MESGIRHTTQSWYYPHIILVDFQSRLCSNGLNVLINYSKTPCYNGWSKYYGRTNIIVFRNYTWQYVMSPKRNCYNFNFKSTSYCKLFSESSSNTTITGKLLKNLWKGFTELFPVWMFFLNICFYFLLSWSTKEFYFKNLKPSSTWFSFVVRSCMRK